MRVVAAPDTFRGTASAGAVAAAIGRVAWEHGWDCDEVPMSDGGEGFLDALGGARPPVKVQLGARVGQRTFALPLELAPGRSTEEKAFEFTL